MHSIYDTYTVVKGSRRKKQRLFLPLGRRAFLVFAGGVPSSLREFCKGEALQGRNHGCGSRACRPPHGTGNPVTHPAGREKRLPHDSLSLPANRPRPRRAAKKGAVGALLSSGGLGRRLFHFLLQGLICGDAPHASAVPAAFRRPARPLPARRGLTFPGPAGNRWSAACPARSG